MKMRFFYSTVMLLMLYQMGQSQHLNFMVDDSVRNRPVYVDHVDRNGLLAGEIGLHFQEDYEAYQPETAAVEQLKSLVNDIQITIIFGSWCGDSKDQLPRFVKLLDMMDFDTEKVFVVGVDSQKKAREIDVQPYAIEKVPTFIFYKNKIEIGRIIETPQESLEKDFLMVVQNANR